MTRDDTELFGVSMSTGCVRGVVVDHDGAVVDARSFATAAEHPLASAAAAARALADEMDMGPDAPVMAVGGDPDEIYGPEGVRLVGECDAVLAAARMDGCVDFAGTVAVIDLGRVGTRVHVLDTRTGELHASVGTTVFGGDVVDAAVVEHLSTTFGAAEKMTDAATAMLATDSRVAKEMLSYERAVDLSGPFVSGSVRLRRTDIELLLAPLLAPAVDLVADAVAAGADAVLMIGGGANIPFVHRAITDRVDVPVVLPQWPQYFVATGAAHLSRVIPSAVVAPAAPAAMAPVVVPFPVDPPAEQTAALQTSADEARTDVFAAVPAPMPVTPSSPPTPTPLPTPRAATTPRRSRRAAASPVRRRSRAGVLVGASALIAAVTLGAATAASGGSESEPVQATDRAVVTSTATPSPVGAEQASLPVPVAVTAPATPTSTPPDSTTTSTSATSESATPSSEPTIESDVSRSSAGAASTQPAAPTRSSAPERPDRGNDRDDDGDLPETHAPSATSQAPVVTTSVKPTTTPPTTTKPTTTTTRTTSH